ncbi:MAG: OPT/YSL family transporter, partial [Myxococcales bacterium]
MSVAISVPCGAGNASLPIWWTTTPAASTDGLSSAYMVKPITSAAANAGATSQDLKTGYLVGATPRAQQIGLMIGAVAAAVVIGITV